MKTSYPDPAESGYTIEKGFRSTMKLRQAEVPVVWQANLVKNKMLIVGKVA